MNDEITATDIRLRQLKAEELIRQGYSKIDLGLLEFIKTSCFDNSSLGIYLERYIHEKVIYKREIDLLQDEKKQLKYEMDKMIQTILDLKGRA